MKPWTLDEVIAELQVIRREHPDLGNSPVAVVVDEQDGDDFSERDVPVMDVRPWFLNLVPGPGCSGVRLATRAIERTPAPKPTFEQAVLAVDQLVDTLKAFPWCQGVAVEEDHSGYLVSVRVDHSITLEEARAAIPTRPGVRVRLSHRDVAQALAAR